jgi:acetyl-CoA carboxylase biotin carboxyl carrier protein
VDDALDVRVRAQADGGWEILAPGVGLWTGAPAHGALLEPGARCGTLVTLGRARALRLPAGPSGAVASDPPTLRRAPVGAGELLFRLTPVQGGGSASVAVPTARAGEGALVFRAAQAGRFWRRPEPGAAAYVGEGELVENGRTIGLLEVMKTFQPVKYRAEHGLPARVKWLHWLAAEGAEVSEGEALAALEAY